MRDMCAIVYCKRACDPLINAELKDLTELTVVQLYTERPSIPVASSLAFV